MSSHSTQLDTLDDLRTFVSHILCEHGQLEAGVFPITEKALVQSGKICGVIFSLHGPRSVVLSAIWVTSNRVTLFYSSTGERFLTRQLTRQPHWRSVLAELRSG